MKNKKGKNLLPKHLFLNPSFVSMVTNQNKKGITVMVGPNTYELIKKADEEDHILGRLQNIIYTYIYHDLFPRTSFGEAFYIGMHLL